MIDNRISLHEARMTTTRKIGVSTVGASLTTIAVIVAIIPMTIVIRTVAKDVTMTVIIIIIGNGMIYRIQKRTTLQHMRMTIDHWHRQSQQSLQLVQYPTAHMR